MKIRWGQSSAELIIFNVERGILWSVLPVTWIFLIAWECEFDVCNLQFVWRKQFRSESSWCWSVVDSPLVLSVVSQGITAVLWFGRNEMEITFSTKNRKCYTGVHICTFSQHPTSSWVGNVENKKPWMISVPVELAGQASRPRKITIPLRKHLCVFFSLWKPTFFCTSLKPPLTTIGSE